jgi:hypothetical protein
LQIENVGEDIINTYDNKYCTGYLSCPVFHKRDLVEQGTDVFYAECDGYRKHENRQTGTGSIHRRKEYRAVMVEG